MKVPAIQLTAASQKAANTIINASKQKVSIGEQMLMANYYAYLYANARKEASDFAKILLHR